MHIFQWIVCITKLIGSLNKQADINYAKQKPYYSPNDVIGGSLTNLTDGNDNTCEKLTARRIYIVLDMKKVISISKIKLLTNKDNFEDEFSVVVSNYFETCSIIKIFDWFLCYTKFERFSRFLESNLDLTESTFCQGRFIAIVAKHPAKIQELDLCEFQIFGKPVNRVTNDILVCEKMDKKFNIAFGLPVMFGSNFNTACLKHAVIKTTCTKTSCLTDGMIKTTCISSDVKETAFKIYFKYMQVIDNVRIWTGNYSDRHGLTYFDIYVSTRAELGRRSTFDIAKKNISLIGNFVNFRFPPISNVFAVTIQGTHITDNPGKPFHWKLSEIEVSGYRDNDLEFYDNFDPSNIKNDYNRYQILLYKIMSNRNFFISEMDEFLVEAQESKMDLRQDIFKLIFLYDYYIQLICPLNIFGMIEIVDRAVIVSFNKLILLQKVMIETLYTPPCQQYFKENVPKNVKVWRNTEIKIKADEFQEIYYSDQYSGAGHTINYTVQEITGKWDITIGCSPLNLDYKEKGDYPVLYRYPILNATNYKLMKGSGKIYSPFGGVISFKSYGGINNSISILLPMLIQRVKINVTNYKEQSKIFNKLSEKDIYRHFAPDSEIHGSVLSITMPTSDMFTKKFDYYYVRFQMYWEPFFKSYYNILGKVPELNPMIRIIFDLQPRSQRFENFNPIQLDISQIEKITEFNPKHERIPSIEELEFMGANWYPKKLMFPQLRDRLNYILTVFYWETTLKLDVFDPKINPLLSVDYYQYYNSSTEAHFIANIKQWEKNIVYGRVMLLHVVKYFGYELFTLVFSQDENSTFIEPLTDIEKQDKWYDLLSTAYNIDVSPMFRFWNFPMSNEAREKHINKKCFMPDDFITRMLPQRAKLYKHNAKTGVKCLTTIKIHDRKPLKSAHRKSSMESLKKY